jgi:PHS family inorganic phosphate transporter-like MFS transporter
LTSRAFQRLIRTTHPIHGSFNFSFYGINLNQNVVLQQIGFDGKTGTAWEKLFKVSTGNIIITALGFVPGEEHILPLLCCLNWTVEGYYASILLIEKLGRKWIQTQGFLMAAVFCEDHSA